MSNIFEALQRSESERTGVDLQGLSTAIQLLEIAEQNATASDANAVQLENVAQLQNIDTPEVKELAQPLPPDRTAGDAPTAIAERSPKDVGVNQFAQFTSLRVLVPPQSKLVCLTDPETFAAEKFRFLAVSLRHLQQSRPLKKLVITSTIPQEGKSMTAANLACALARKKNQKTILVEGDLRRPSIAQLFGLGKTPGICEWLQGECGPTKCIYQLEGAGLFLLPAGTVPRNPLELMQSGRLAPLLDQIAAWFDWIVIDSPPVLPLADTSIWMRLAEGILLITRQGLTKRKQLQRGLEVIERTKLLGTLLNSSVNGTNGDYYSYYSNSVAPSTNSQRRN